MQGVLKFLVTITFVLTGVATAANALENTFRNPTYKQRARLDVCYTLGKNCGQPVADTYCKIQGYEGASLFETERARPTRTILGGKVCDGSHCTGFKHIVCWTSAATRGKGIGWPQIID